MVNPLDDKGKDLMTVVGETDSSSLGWFGTIMGSLWGMARFLDKISLIHISLDLHLADLIARLFGKSKPDPDPGRPYAYLVSVAGQLAGNCHTLNSGSPVVIGRNPIAARVVYPENCLNISRIHAEVSYHADSGKFHLKDLESARGTFRRFGKQKLAAGATYTLEPGEFFYLADEQEMFQVTTEKPALLEGSHVPQTVLPA